MESNEETVQMHVVVNTPCLVGSICSNRAATLL
jgi:hypothetical protein